MIMYDVICHVIYHQLVHDFDSDSQVQHLVEKYEWLIVPIVNVDGYYYTWDRVSWYSDNIII